MRKKLYLITSSIIFAIMILLMAFFRYPEHYSTYSGLSNKEKELKIKKERISMITSEYPTSGECKKSSTWVRVYTYIMHYIVPDELVDKNNTNEYMNSVSPEFLEKFFRYLFKKRDEKVIYIANMYELSDFKKNDCYPAMNIVLLTFDDWWKDNYEFLFPLAKKYNIPVNLSLISSKIEKTIWNTNYMTKEEIQEMLDSGLFTLASHTFSHQDVTKISAEKAENEICDSKRDLEAMFWVKINSIVYPWWNYDDISTRFARSCWYEFWFTTLNKSFFSEDLNSKSYWLTRIKIHRNVDIEKLFEVPTKLDDKLIKK